MPRAQRLQHVAPDQHETAPELQQLDRLIQHETLVRVHKGQREVARIAGELSRIAARQPAVDRPRDLRPTDHPPRHRRPPYPAPRALRPRRAHRHTTPRPPPAPPPTPPHTSPTPPHPPTPHHPPPP